MTIEQFTPLDPPVAASVEEFVSPAPEVEVARPRIRWAGIVWGSFFAVLAAAALWWLVDQGRRAATRDWVLSLTPDSVSLGAVIGIGVLCVGMLLLIAGAVALLRRAQLRLTIQR
jgi:hypothetical protein